MRIQAAAPLIPLLLLSAGASLAQRGAPSVETAKQVLEQKWQKLRPDYATERNVLFQDVRAGRSSSGSYQFTVSAIIRDYGPGYPPNRYYGQTCVARIQEWTYTLWSDGNTWQVDGRMTPDLANTKCQNNPSAGVSSFPLQSLSGSSASTGTVAAPPAPQRSGGVVEGPYECWANGQARGLLNFTIRGGGQYAGTEGGAGSFTYDPGSSRITFRGGPLADLGAGFYSIYYEPQGRPTVSIRSQRGGEVTFCQKR